MSYSNPRHEGRMVLIDHMADAFATLHVLAPSPDCFEAALEGAASKAIRKVPEIGLWEGRGDLFNFPFLFHANAEPWVEANSYLRHLAELNVSKMRPSDELRRRASKLLDYLVFCETESLNWLDFSGRRPALRPTYRYFAFLLSNGKRSVAVVNQYTGVVYDFYKFVSANWHCVDMRRVDSVSDVRFLVKNSYGASRMIKAEKRSQAGIKPPKDSVPMGFVRESGEDLRPLTNLELGKLMSTLKSSEWSAQERLILLASLMTGARKQTVLTLRIKHLRSFVPENLQCDGCYILHAGPKTGIDTKKSRSQRLYVPKQLAEELRVFAYSPLMVERRLKFEKNLANVIPEVSMDKEDYYLFLSDQGGCYYMAKDDPRYEAIKSPATGQVTDTIKRKLLSKISEGFPFDFSYHWLRATFAFQLYQRLNDLVVAGVMRPGDVIEFIKERMHHASREMTEHYLQLFKMLPDIFVVQEHYEGVLFWGQYDELKLDGRNEY